jgi:flagellar biosynthesis protein FliQ
MQDVDMLLEPLRAFLSQVGVFLPRLLLAVVVLAAGWALAKLARFTMGKALRAVNFGVLTERAGLDGFLRQGGLQHDTSALFALLVYWLVILAALVVASNGLGLNAITELLGRVLWFVPRVLVALLILAFGSYFARFIGGSVRSFGRSIDLQDTELLARVAQGAVQVFVVLIALDHLDIGGSIVQSSFLILLAGVVFAVALAFGLGGRDWAAARIARWLSHEPPPPEDRWR